MRYNPDGSILEPGLIRQCINFAPNNNGAYGRIPALVAATTTALTTGRCLGAAVVKNLAGTPKLYAGSSTKPYQANGSGGWTDRSGGTSYTAAGWEFCAFGDQTIAANGDTRPVMATTGNFASLTQAPVGAKIIFPHANGLIALNTTADGASWARCKSGDSATWTPASNNDADTGTLYGGIGGPVIAGGAWENLALAWKSRAMYAATYRGNYDPDQPVLDWRIVATDIGCVAQNAHIATEVGEVFVSERGIMLFNGNKPFPIDGPIRKTFMREAMVNRSRIFCTLDEGRNHVYIWISPSGASFCTAAYIWNYREDTWGHTDELADKTSLTHGDLRTPVRNANYQDMVAIGGFTTNTTETANFIFSDTGDYLLSLSGQVYTSASPTGDAVLQTGLLGVPGMDVTIKRVIPVVDAYIVSNTAPTLEVLVFDSNLNLLETTSPIALSSYGQWDVVRTGRYLQLQITAGTTAGGPNYSGFIVEYTRQNSSRVETLTI